ncbi:MAG: GNAT family N-acetyltransferase [Rhodomicrobium sp.]
MAAGGRRSIEGSAAAASADNVLIRAVRADDLPAIVKLDEAATGTSKIEHWRELLADLEHGNNHDLTFLVAELDGRVIGFITGNVRAFEFGSEACGWVFALCVDSAVRVKNVGTQLFDALCGHFRQAGVAKVRTMVARNNDLVLAFFRSLGLMAGPFLQLEKDLD